jgi:hypothetical protein
MSLLHLTDLHFGQPSLAAYWSAATRAFREDLEHLLRTAPPVDLVLVTGDVAYRGGVADYIRASEFFDPLMERLAVANPAVRLACVPGNHDLVRPDGTSSFAHLVDTDRAFVLQQLEQALASNTQHEVRRSIEGAFAHYDGWMAGLDQWSPEGWSPGLLPGDGFGRCQVDDVSLGLICVNTSLFQVTDRAGPGSLAVAARQIDHLASIALTEPPAFSYVLCTHHPLQWLDDASRELLSDTLYANLPIGLQMCGHMHDANFTTMSAGADPRVRQHLQGRSFFGQEYLADGRTKRQHGYALVALRSDQRALMVAPRRAVPRPSGGPTFEPDQGPAWFLEKGSEWTTNLALLCEANWTAPRRDGGASPPVPPVALDPPPPGIDESAGLIALAEIALASLDPERPAEWYRPPVYDQFLRNLQVLSTLAPDLPRPTDAEIKYIWALILFGSLRCDLVLPRFADWTAFGGDLDWSRDYVRAITAHGRLATRATDELATAQVRAALGEWLLRGALLASDQTWATAEVHSSARRIAAILEGRPAEIDQTATRMVQDAMAVFRGSIARAHLSTTWALGLPDGTLAHMRSEVVLPLAFAAVALTPDVIAAGAELVEQVGVVESFALPSLHADLDRVRWVATSAGHLGLIADCFDPAVEVYLRAHASVLQSRGEQLPNSGTASVVGATLGRPVDLTGLRPQRSGGTSSYTAPISRIVLDSQRIRSLLMGEQLYGQARLAIRELYQNSLDACRYRALRHRFLTLTQGNVDSQWSGQIQMRASYDSEGHLPVLECQDDGVGMYREVLAACFLSAGSRFVETPSFTDEQTNWLSADPGLRLYPNSTFGIGAFSYFMLADVVEVLTRPQGPDGQYGGPSRLQINAGSSVARIADWPEGVRELPRGGTIVRLHLRPEYRSVSRLQLANFLDDVVALCPFELVVQEGHQTTAREAGKFSPDVRSPHTVAWSTDESAAWWRVGDGQLYADGIKTPSSFVGIMVNLHGEKKPVLRVDRNAVVKFDLSWVLDRTAERAEALANWGGVSLAWLWQFAERYPQHGQRLFDDFSRIRDVVPLGQSRLWDADVKLSDVGCFPGDRYLISELGDHRRRESEYEEIEIPEVTRRSDRFGGLKVTFPSCLRPWRRRVWLDALPELFEGWSPDARELLGSPVETVRSLDPSTPVWEPESLRGLVNPGPLDALLVASQPDLLSLSFSADGGHTAVVDVVAFVHGAHRADMTLGEAVRRLGQFVRFGLRGLPSVAQDAYDYVPTLLDCRLVAALGRAWPTSHLVTREELLQLIPVCQEHGYAVADAVDAAKSLLRRLGVHVDSLHGRKALVDHVPSVREVRFFGFGEYDSGRELRHGRGTRAALVRASWRADMRWSEVGKTVARYRTFGLAKYASALKLLDLRPEDTEYLRAWSASFDSRSPWVDEEVFRRGFIGDSPSSSEELLGHAVFYAVLSGVPLRRAAEIVLAFPGLAPDQRFSVEEVPDVVVHERDLEMLKNRIGRTSSYADKRLGGIGQQELVRRTWSILELKAAARGVEASMKEVFERLEKFAFLGVALPDCGPDIIDGYEFSELETALLTTKDRSLGEFGRFGGFHDDDRKPITGPIPPRHVMAVAQEHHLSLGEVMATLQGMAMLGVRHGARDLPPHLQSYIPTATEVELAMRFDAARLGHALAEHAFSRTASIRYLADLVRPWLAWLSPMGTAADSVLDEVVDACGERTPSYSELSFVAAAESLATSNGTLIDGYVLSLLAAQGNVTLETTTKMAREWEVVLRVDGSVCVPGDEYSRWAAETPDGRWVLALDDSAIAGRARTRIREYLGVSKEFQKSLRGLRAPRAEAAPEAIGHDARDKDT